MADNGEIRSLLRRWADSGAEMKLAMIEMPKAKPLAMNTATVDFDGKRLCILSIEGARYRLGSIEENVELKLRPVLRGEAGTMRVTRTAVECRWTDGTYCLLVGPS